MKSSIFLIIFLISLISCGSKTDILKPPINDTLQGDFWNEIEMNDVQIIPISSRPSQQYVSMITFYKNKEFYKRVLKAEMNGFYSIDIIAPFSAVRLAKPSVSQINGIQLSDNSFFLNFTDKHYGMSYIFDLDTMNYSYNLKTIYTISDCDEIILEQEKTPNDTVCRIVKNKTNISIPIDEILKKSLDTMEKFMNGQNHILPIEIDTLYILRKNEKEIARWWYQ